MKGIHAFSLILLMGLLGGCGSVENVSQKEISTGDVAPGTNAVFLFSTDFQSSGQLLTADYQSANTINNTGVAGLGSSAVIRFFDGMVYVLHDGFSVGSSDNVQIIDPLHSDKTVNQFSTGNGTNPQDMVVVDGKAYISLYNPEKDVTNVDEKGHPGDVIVMNLTDGSIEKRISFFDFLNDDGTRTAQAATMVRVDNFLYVCVQDLQVQGFDFQQNAPGKIGVINLSTNQIEKVITLKGRNPVDISYSQTEKKFFVALQAPYDSTLGNFDTSQPYGGIEIVPVDAPQNTILINDEDLGGYVERLSHGDDFLFAVVSQLDPQTFAFTSDIYKMPDTNETPSGLTKLIIGSSDVREISVDAQKRIWVSRRSIVQGQGQAQAVGVDVFNVETGAQVGTTLSSSVPVTSIAFGSL